MASRSLAASTCAQSSDGQRRHEEMQSRSRSQSNSRSQSRSKVCGAYRRGRGLCPGVFRLPPGVIRQPRARPNRTLRPSPNQRPIVLLTPTTTNLQPTLASFTRQRGDSRYRWLGRFVLVHSRPAAALLLVLCARPDLLFNRFQRPRCLLELDPARNQRQRSAEPEPEPEPEPGLGGDGPALADGARGSLRDELGRLGSPVPNAELPHLLDEVAVLRGAPASGVDIAGRGAAAERAAVRAAQRWGAGAPPAVRANRMISQTGPVQHKSLRGWRGTRLPGSFWPSKTSYSGCSFR